MSHVTTDKLPSHSLFLMGKTRLECLHATGLLQGTWRPKQAAHALVPPYGLSPHASRKAGRDSALMSALLTNQVNVAPFKPAAQGRPFFF